MRPLLPISAPRRLEQYKAAFARWEALLPSPYCLTPAPGQGNQDIMVPLQSLRFSPVLDQQLLEGLESGPESSLICQCLAGYLGLRLGPSLIIC